MNRKIVNQKYASLFRKKTSLPKKTTVQTSATVDNVVEVEEPTLPEATTSSTLSTVATDVPRNVELPSVSRPDGPYISYLKDENRSPLRYTENDPVEVEVREPMDEEVSHSPPEDMVDEPEEMIVDEPEEQLDDLETLQEKFCNYAKDIIDYHRKKIQSELSRANPVDSDIINEQFENELCAIIPPIENFMGLPLDTRKELFFGNLKSYDVLIGKIKRRGESGFVIQVLSMDAGKRRDLSGINIIADCPYNMAPVSGPHARTIDEYEENDYVRVVVASVIPDAEKIFVSMMEDHLPRHLDPSRFPLGKISEEELPIHFTRLDNSLALTNYDTLLKQNVAFNNQASTAYLARTVLHVFPRNGPDMLSFLADRYDKEFDKTQSIHYLRNRQSFRWAEKPLREGIALMRQEKNVEALQLLNKALHIDDQSVAAYVARGSLYANEEHYSKAIEDFETALKLDPTSKNATNYLSETLVNFGKKKEEDGEFASAKKMYERSLKLVPFNESATRALYALENRLQSVSEMENNPSTSMMSGLLPKPSFVQNSKFSSDRNAQSPPSQPFVGGRSQSPNRSRRSRSRSFSPIQERGKTSSPPRVREFSPINRSRRSPSQRRRRSPIFMRDGDERRDENRHHDRKRFWDDMSRRYRQEDNSRQERQNYRGSNQGREYHQRPPPNRYANRVPREVTPERLEKIEDRERRCIEAVRKMFESDSDD